MPRPQLARETLIACWEDEASMDSFVENDPGGQVFAGGWSVKMELFRSVGVWPGIDDDMDAVAGEGSAPESGPSVAITIGTAYLRTIRPFLKVNAGLEEQFLRSSDAIWGTGFTNLPQRLVGTLTVWDHADSAERFMRSGAHGAAVRAHFDPAKDPTGHTFVTGGGFFGFRPISMSGGLSGRNSVPELLSDPSSV
ncbi:MAG: hypothetical protein ACR2OH_07915 [Microthrixaceae bacterium]